MDMHPLLIAPLALFACGQPDAEPLLDEADEALLTSALDAANPEPLIEIVDETRNFVPIEDGCPQIDVRVGEPGREIWLGGCTQDSGLTIEGQLEKVTSPDSAWVAADAFTVRRGGEIEFFLDGAVEIQEQGGLQLIDGAASWCGEPGPACTSGPVTLDLAFTIFSDPGQSEAYDATVSGAVGLPEGLVSIEGTWRIDDLTCPSEPVTGSFAMRTDQGHAIEMDGERSCDGCAAWMLQGIEITPFCGFEL